MLDTIPSEVLSHIALHLSLPTCAPSVPLLLTSRTIHATLSPASNPRLYARIFRASFDVSAAERRLGDLNAVAFAAELKRRVGSLRRLSRQVRDGDVKEVREEDLWVLYVMLVENDGLNLDHLVTKDAEFHLPTFLRFYHEQQLLPAALEPGYPVETVNHALALWIAWILHNTAGQKLHEPPEQREERLFLLRPFVFAAQRYELCYAPWTIQDLPISTATQPSPIRQLIPGPFVADLAPRSRVVTIEYYGRKMELCPPILAHAAILRFFAKKLRTNVNQPGQNGVLRGVDPYPGLPGRYVNGDDDSEDEGDDDEEEEEAGGSVINDSRQHDRDFTRLISCYDPSVCRGMKRASWRGSWDGCWEGKFSFFDFDAFRDMLAGQSRALYEGSFGEQAQVWRLKETYVRPVGHKGTKGKGKGKAGGLPLKGPMTNAGFPTDQPSSTGAGLGTPAAEEKTMRETINQQVDAIQGYEIVPDDEVDEALSDDRGEEEGLEMLLTGTGHSAWGPFILKGRVRAWDGMASLVKEYAPDSRGKWIYRGYILSGDVFVGRWRDTFTPETLVGYEGTFILNRR